MLGRGLFLAALLLAGFPAEAADPRAVTLRFKAMVGSEPFACGRSYDGIGTAKARITPADFRFYVSGVQLIDRAGKAVPVDLTQDRKWQHRDVALLDFEDKSGPCLNGTAETNLMVRGSVPAGDYAGVRFTLGVPFWLNHEDALLAYSPLNLSGLFWSWLAGYKFLRLDMAVSRGPGFVVHLGSTACQPPGGMAGGHGAHAGHRGAAGAAASQRPARCDNPNRPVVAFAAFDPDKDVIVADVGTLLAGTDVTVNQPDTALGCLASPNDRDCTGIMAAFGLPSGIQSFFRVEAGR